MLIRLVRATICCLPSHSKLNGSKSWALTSLDLCRVCTKLDLPSLKLEFETAWTSPAYGSILSVILSSAVVGARPCLKTASYDIRNSADSDQYYPVMNTPVHAAVTLLSDPPFHAKLREDIIQGDPDSVLRDEVKVFHGLSISGDVTAKYVYVGYGRKADFDLLAARGEPGFSYRVQDLGRRYDDRWG
jgi:hypothetical protein